MADKETQVSASDRCCLYLLANMYFRPRNPLLVSMCLAWWLSSFPSVLLLYVFNLRTSCFDSRFWADIMPDR